MTEQETLDAWRRAIAATDEARRAWSPTRESSERQAHAEDWERNCGRRYLAARDAATAREVTCSEAGPGAADFAGDGDG